MQGNINIPDSTITTNLSFRQLVLMNMQQLTNFPYIEKDFDALTDYELLCLVVKYLNDVIDNQNEQNASITRMYESFLDLQNYVNNTKDELEDAFNNLDDYVRNYFDNLDVQDEINNKLDQMLEDGVLTEIIQQFLQSTAIWCFDTVADMKQATNLINGSYAKTLGYYSSNDGGSGLYKITNTQSQTDFQETLNNGLYATLIINDYIIPNQLGAYGDGVHNDSQAIQQAISSRHQVKFNKQSYLIGNTITIGSNKIIDFNWATLITSDGVTAFTINKNNGDNVFTYITLENAFVNMENGGNFIEDMNNYNVTYDNIRINHLHGSNFGFKITNGFNHRFLNVWINGKSDSEDNISGNLASGIIYDIDGNTDIAWITNVTNTSFKDCLIQGLYNGIRFDRTGASGSYDTTFMENMGFSSCDKAINVNNTVMYDINIQTIRCEFCGYALYIKGSYSALIINNLFSNGTYNTFYNEGHIKLGGYLRLDSQNRENCYIIDNNSGQIYFDNCCHFQNVNMTYLNPTGSYGYIEQFENLEPRTNSGQTLILHPFIKFHYIQTTYLDFANITIQHDGQEFMITNARDSGSLLLPDNTYLAVGETVKCYVINNSIKYIKLA